MVFFDAAAEKNGSSGYSVGQKLLEGLRSLPTICACPRMSADVRGLHGPFLGCPRLVRAIAFRDLFYGSCPRLSAGVGNRFNERYSCPHNLVIFKLS